MDTIKALRFIWIPALVIAGGFALGSVLLSEWPSIIGIAIGIGLGVYLMGTPPTV